MLPLLRSALATALLFLPLSVAQSQEVERVSLYRLIASPDPYDGKRVFVEGYVRIALENMSICPTREPLSLKDCLWLTIDDGPFNSDADADRYWKREKQWRKFDKQVAFIFATFDKMETGHLGGWSGGLKSITRVSGRAGTLDF